MEYKKREVDGTEVWSKDDAGYASGKESIIWGIGLVALIALLLAFAHSQGWTWN